MNWLVKIGREVVQALTDPYRPELHYMRGPGPAWCKKHGVTWPLPTTRR